MAFFAPSPHVDNQEASADGDATVGDVEVGEVIALARMELDEIGDSLVYDPVVEVSHRAAQDEGERDTHQPVAALGRTGSFQKYRDDDYEDGGRQTDQNEHPDPAFGVGEESESDTWI